MAKFMKQERKAVSIMVQIYNKDGDFFRLCDVEGMSLSYAEQIISKLKRAGLVASARGPGGGYCFPNDNQNPSVGKVVMALKPKAGTTAKAKDNTDQFFDEAETAIINSIMTVTIQDVAHGNFF